MKIYGSTGLAAQGDDGHGGHYHVYFPPSLSLYFNVTVQNPPSVSKMILAFYGDDGK
ncbi:hypothetical protein FTV88_0930 [Heliorestis convoluta]|uniref:Uncharacterized protein n=1 Tax=Heliorestis convoluta TaxID=356322 RepID=A0A5Q2N1B3_9FIRM|nr:hypothetical protein FTV88_0930 [Heliorestis convoluta]